MKLLPPLHCCWPILIAAGCLGAQAQVGGPGHALVFDGSQNQNLQVAANPNLTPNQLTFEAWVNVYSAVCGTILSRGNGGDGTTTDYILQIGNNGTSCETKLSFFGVGAWDTSTNTLVPYLWTHVAVTFDGVDKQFYINGVPDRTAPRPGSLYHSTTAMFIGVQGATCFCNPFSGIIDEIRIWNTVRTPAQIQQYMHQSLSGGEPGLVAYYRMDEGSGTTTADATGHGYTAVMGAGTQAPEWVIPGEVLGPPWIETLPVTGLTVSSATLNAQVIPEAQATSTWFEWGTNVSYGNTTVVVNVGNGAYGVPVSATVSGLTLGTTYHYQLWATNSSGTSVSPDAAFTSSVAPALINPLATNVGAFSATLEAMVNPNGAATTVLFSYGTNVPYSFTNVVSNIGTQPGLVLVTNLIQNLRLGALYHYQITATNSAGRTASPDQTFLAAGPPYAVTDFASNITTTGSATLRGVAFPNGADSTAWFQWGSETNYGNVTPPIQLAATNLDVSAISNTLSGLASGTVWHYQLLASNSFGVTLGGDVSFISPGLPVISAQSVSSPSPSSANFSAAVFPAGLDTTAWFQYGANTNYGSSTGSTLVSGGNFAPLTVGASIGGLSPSVTYHFRSVASNLVGVAYGPDELFTTVVFTNYSVPGANFAFGVPAWGDYDGDGWLDLVLSGSLVRNNQFYNESEIWRNTGTGFTNVDNSLPGHSAGSVTWSDFDNDGKPDLLITSGYYGNEFSTVYRNTGNGFVEYAALPGLTRNWVQMSCADFNNDGHPDILISGISPPSSCTIQLWQNTGTNFNSFDPGLSHLMSGAMAWGDFDNDGLLDLLVAGVVCDGPGQAVEVWRNTGTGFVNMNTGLPGLYYGTVAWGDYDNDGRLDILICGTLDGSTFLTQVWHNDGNGQFSNINAGLPGVIGTAAWGDYDNDGRLDILVAGQQSTSTTDYILQVWRNTGAGFVNINAFPGIYAYGAIWGDFNNDGRLDILARNATTALWQNVCPVTNTPPTAPAGLTAATSTSSVRLSWNAASDAQTPASGLSYNIRVGTQPGGVDVVSPLADALTGFRRVVGLGNAQMNRFAFLNGLAPGRYYWSVQAIDTAFAGGPFAAEEQFTIGSVPPPSFGPLTFQSGVLTVQCTGQAQTGYTVHTSTDLVNWTVLTNLTADSNGQFQFSVPVSASAPAGFFRLSQP